MEIPYLSKFNLYFYRLWFYLPWIYVIYNKYKALTAFTWTRVWNYFGKLQNINLLKNKTKTKYSAFESHPFEWIRRGS